jgi:small subunit ribosomal protein S20
VTNMRTYIKKVEEAITAGNADEAKLALREAQPKIMSVAQKGILHKNTASRKISRLAKRVKNLS